MTVSRRFVLILKGPNAISVLGRFGLWKPHCKYADFLGESMVNFAQSAFRAAGLATSPNSKADL
jgi:hypothetical protein